MAPLSATSTTYTTTYLTVDCIPTSSDYSCVSSSTPLTSTGQGYTAIAQYMQATRSTITDGAIGFGPLEMLWRATPLAILTDWDAAVSFAMPADFDSTEEITLATALLTTDSTPAWIAQLSRDVQLYYVSVSLPMYTTPVKYYEYYQFVSTNPLQPSRTSVLVGAGATTTTSRLNSAEASSTMTGSISAGLASTRQTISSPTDLSDETSAPSEAGSKDTIVSPGQKVAIAVSVVATILAAICGIVVYFGKIRPSRRRRLAEANQASVHHSHVDETKALPPFESDRQHSHVSSWSGKPQTTISSLAELQASTLSPVSELEDVSAAGTSGHHTSYHGSVELSGYSLTRAGGEGFMIDAGVHLPSQATSNDR